MPDNVQLNAGSGGAVLAAASLSISGDTAMVQMVGPGILSGSEGSWSYSLLAGGAGAVDAGTQRVTLASDDPAVALLTTVDADTSVLAGAVSAGAIRAAQSGTWTVDLGAVDNAVLDAIAALLTTIDADTSVLAAAVSTEVQVDVVGPLPAGTNNIGDVDVLTLPSAISGPGNPTIDSFGSAAISAAADTANQEVIAAPGAGKQIWVYGVTGTADTGDGTIAFQDEDDTALTGAMPVAENGGFVVPMSGNFAMPWIKLATDKALEIDTVTCGFKGIITYAVVSVGS